MRARGCNDIGRGAPAPFCHIGVDHASRLPVVLLLGRPRCRPRPRPPWCVEASAAGHSGARRCDGRLLASPDGAESGIAVADLVLLHGVLPPPPPKAPPAPLIAPEPAMPPPADDLLLLAGPAADRLVGRVVGGDADGVQFQLAAGAAFTVSYDRIARLLPAARLPVDRLLLWPGGGAATASGARARRRHRQLTSVVDASRRPCGLRGRAGAPGVPARGRGGRVLADAGAPDDAPLPGVPRASPAARACTPACSAGRDARRAGHALRAAPELPASALLALVRRRRRVLLADLAPVGVGHRRRRRPACSSVALICLSPAGCSPSTATAPPTSASTPTRASSSTCRPPAALRVTAGLCDEVRELPAVGSVEFRARGRPTARLGARRTTRAELRAEGLAGAKTLRLRVTDSGDDAGATARPGWTTC
jgi:hypothetical protein